MENVKQKLAKSNQSIEKALQIIDVLANHPGPMRLQEISKESGIPASTVLRLLNTLYKHDYISQDPGTLHYSLTLKFAQIGNLVKSKFSISDVSRPFLLELSSISQEATCIAVEQEMAVCYIDTVDGPDRILQTMQHIGKRAPLHCTGSGKLMLLDYDETKLAHYIETTGLKPLTRHTLRTKGELLAELEKIRKQDFSVDDEECEIGIRCASAPIRDFSGSMIACISVFGPAVRMSIGKIDSLKESVKSVAHRISEKYAYRG